MDATVITELSDPVINTAQTLAAVGVTRVGRGPGRPTAVLSANSCSTHISGRHLIIM